MKKLFFISTLCTLTLPFTAYAAGEWDGAYIGLKAGIGTFNTDGRTVQGPFKTKDDSALLGGLVGFRTELINDIVAGIEGDLNYDTNLKDMRYNAAAIIGVKYKDDGLVFAKFGYGGIKLDGGSEGGVLVGAGYEHRLNEQLNLRFSYHMNMYSQPEVTIPDELNYKGNDFSISAIYNF